MAQPQVRLSFRTLWSRIHLRERLPFWGLRLLFGLMLMTLSELVMWQHPDSRAIWEWPLLLLMYVALASIMIDVLVRFQARDIPGLLLVSGLYGIVSSVVISHSAFENVPFSLIIRGLGLQTAAGFYGILLYIMIMRGKDIQWQAIAAAVGVGVLWGVWVHWYPVQVNIGWNTTPVSIETAIIYLLPALILIGLLINFAVPRFRFVREEVMQLEWWEAILTGLPLFISLLIGMFQPNGKGGNLIPGEWVGVAVLIGAYCVWTLNNRNRGYEPSILAEALYAAPNLATYLIVVMAFIMSGAVAYNFIDNADSPVGVVAYFIIFGFGSAWLPLASFWIFWRTIRPLPTTDVTENEKD